MTNYELLIYNQFNNFCMIKGGKSDIVWFDIHTNYLCKNGCSYRCPLAFPATMFMGERVLCYYNKLYVFFRLCYGYDKY